MMLLLRCLHRPRTAAARKKTHPSLRSPRLLSCHGTSTTSPEKANSQHKPTRSVLSSTRASRTLHFSSSRSSHKGNSPSRVLMQVLRRRSCTVAKRVRVSCKTMLISPLLHLFPTMIADMPTAVNPHLYAHQLLQLYQGQGGPAFDSRIKETFSLADWLGVTPSCKTIHTLDAPISASISETTLSLMDDSHDLEPFGYPPGDLLPIPSLDTVVADASSTTTYLVELSSDEKEPAQTPPIKWKRTCGSHGSCCHAIEPPPTCMMVE